MIRFANVCGELISIPSRVFRQVADMNYDIRLSRKEAAHALTEVNYRITVPPLVTLASRGLGPTYIRFGKRTIYRWADRKARARERPSIPSTMETGDALLPRVMKRVSR
jgi:hypothetical protein